MELKRLVKIIIVLNFVSGYQFIFIGVGDSFLAPYPHGEYNRKVRKKTDASENITLPHTSYAGGNNISLILRNL